MAIYLFGQRKFLIRPRFQLLFASKAVSILFLYSAAITYASLRSMAEAIYILPFACLTPEVKTRLWRVPTEALLLSLLIALVVVLQAILITHRVAGPEFRLSRTIREMAAGQNPHVVTLRKHDNLKELAASISFLAQALDQRRQVCLEQLDQIDGARKACTMAIRNHVHPETIQAQLEGLRKQIDSLKEFVAEGTGPRRGEQGSPGSQLDGMVVPIRSGAPDRV
jgi:HAMP domain-containing protein